MSIGKSGRTVIEIDPEIKRQLYSQLDEICASEGLSKTDFVRKAIKSWK